MREETNGETGDDGVLLSSVERGGSPSVAVASQVEGLETIPSARRAWFRKMGSPGSQARPEERRVEAGSLRCDG